MSSSGRLSAKMMVTDVSSHHVNRKEICGVWEEKYIKATKRTINLISSMELILDPLIIDAYNIYQLNHHKELKDMPSRDE